MEVKNTMISLPDKIGTKFKMCAVLVAISLMVLVVSGNAYAVTPWYMYGGSHTVMLNQDGTVWTVGSNNHGQLGIGNTGGENNEPVKVNGLNNITAVAAGGSHSVALRQDGTVWTWGFNGSGQLGNGTKSSSNIPVQVSGLKDIIAIAAGYGHVAALKKDGTVWAWGSNSSGQLGADKTNSFSTPIRTSGLQGISAIAAGAYHTVALKNDGTVCAWGFNGSGQLGDNTKKSNYIPVKIGGLDNITAITAGKNHTVALHRDGSVWAWGSNLTSQLGDSSTSEGSLQPVKVAGLKNVADIHATIDHTFALMKDGTVWGWGDKGTDKWGNGLSMNGSSSPVQMRGVSNVILSESIGKPYTIDKHNDTTLASDK
jgi:alpha-tubulin suppressor-like RCC1 family protein